MAPRILTLLAAISLLVLYPRADGQPTSHAHQHPQSVVIDGAVNPELISDLTAYRLFLVSVSRSQILPTLTGSGSKRNWLRLPSATRTGKPSFPS
jgi:hypothetical protein